jgi:hypothetical protein
MDLEKTINRFFSESKSNLVKWNEANHDKLHEIKLKENELKTNLSYMGHLYIVDNEGYLRGFINFGGYKRNPENPDMILSNIGKIKIWYEELPDSSKCAIWKVRPNEMGNKYSKDELLQPNEVIKYLLDNTQQIREDQYKIRK